MKKLTAAGRPWAKEPNEWEKIWREVCGMHVGISSDDIKAMVTDMRREGYNNPTMVRLAIEKAIDDVVMGRNRDNKKAGPQGGTPQGKR